MIAAESASHPSHVELPAAGRIASSAAVRTEDGQEHLSVPSPPKVPPGSAPIAPILDYPLDEALAAYRGVIMPMLAMLLVGLLAMLAGAALIARGVSRPLEVLAAAARRV